MRSSLGGDEDSKLRRNTGLQLAITACDTSASVRRVKHPIFSETILSDSSFRAHDNASTLLCLPTMCAPFRSLYPGAQGNVGAEGARPFWSVVA